MNKKTLQEKIEILQTNVSDLENQVNLLSEEAYLNGFHLKNHPFIPEYLGFIESKSIDTAKTGEIKARIYTLKGYNISRPVSTVDHKWYIMGPNGEINHLLMPNMHDGITALRACGMNVTMDDYYNQNRLQEKITEDNIVEAIESERERNTEDQ